MVFQVGPGPVTCSEAIQQKKKLAMLCDSMPKSIDLITVKLSLE